MFVALHGLAFLVVFMTRPIMTEDEIRTIVQLDEQGMIHHGAVIVGRDFSAFFFSRDGWSNHATHLLFIIDVPAFFFAIVPGLVLITLLRILSVPLSTTASWNLLGAVLFLCAIVQWQVVGHWAASVWTNTTKMGRQPA